MTMVQWSGRHTGRRFDTAHPIVWYVAAGAVTTGLQELVFLAARPFITSVAANVLAIALTTLANTEFHRRVTFAQMRTSALKLHVQSLGTFVFYAGYGSIVLLLLQTFVDAPSATLEAVILALTSAVGGVLRFIVLRWWVFTTR
ncbi:GtrA family protein [Amycolatopsis pithecellobii]|uniref:GtrA family protein n=1 Tax=Amycolatopsis pithecellobii TaxID=664692 RepID=A0A6N7YIL6_9PSEU|nr:GtrA family protein [Amycolatopsis pithecellobii]MTD52755.1 GtrA family protein [Amycolatopsis pithecellobii]